MGTNTENDNFKKKKLSGIFMQIFILNSFEKFLSDYGKKFLSTILSVSEGMQKELAETNFILQESLIVCFPSDSL